MPIDTNKLAENASFVQGEQEKLNFDGEILYFCGNLVIIADSVCHALLGPMQCCKFCCKFCICNSTVLNGNLLAVFFRVRMACHL